MTRRDAEAAVGCSGPGRVVLRRCASMRADIAPRGIWLTRRAAGASSRRRAGRELRGARGVAALDERDAAVLERLSEGVCHAERIGARAHAARVDEIIVVLARHLAEGAVAGPVLEARDRV